MKRGRQQQHLHRHPEKQLEDDNAHIIITTIQKLSTFIKKYPAHEVYQKHVVIIFDECHRSQFGDMHTAIVKNFKKYHLFGFTGTPIFATNTRAAGGRSSSPPPRLSATSSTRTPSWTPSTTRMCCHSGWTTSRLWTPSRTLTTRRSGTSTGKRPSWRRSASNW